MKAVCNSFLDAALQASRSLALISAKQKNAILKEMAAGLLSQKKTLLKANTEDVNRAKKEGANGGFLDRLRLTEAQLEGMVAELKTILALPDPVGQVIDESVRPNGLRLKRIRVPLGVVAMVYESRPNVTWDAAALCIKSGNAVLLKGGKEAEESNKVLLQIIAAAIRSQGVPEQAVQLLPSDRLFLKTILQQGKGIDVVIPRGGKKLIDFVRRYSRAPILETGASVVHLFVDEAADLKKAAKIVLNAKTRRVSVCNALDVLLVHRKVAGRFLPMIAETFLKEASVSKKPLVEIRGASALRAYFKQYPSFRIQTKKDFDTEFLDYRMAVKIVSGLDEALAHIAAHSLKHSESIITENRNAAERFLKEVDAACVYLNASTQFSDGAEFGLGAEIGISTQKLHARGPFALEGLTSYKWVIRGNGQIRP